MKNDERGSSHNECETFVMLKANWFIELECYADRFRESL